MLLMVVDERRAARNAPQPQAQPRQVEPKTETTQATQFAAALAAATSRR